MQHHGEHFRFKKIKIKIHSFPELRSLFLSNTRGFEAGGLWARRGWTNWLIMHSKRADISPLSPAEALAVCQGKKLKSTSPSVMKTSGRAGCRNTAGLLALEQIDIRGLTQGPGFIAGLQLRPVVLHHVKYLRETFVGGTRRLSRFESPATGEGHLLLLLLPPTSHWRSIDSKKDKVCRLI